MSVLEAIGIVAICFAIVGVYILGLVFSSGHVGDCRCRNCTRRMNQ